MRVVLQPAFLIHQRTYRESSLLLDVFTKEYGRISLIGRGVRGKHSKNQPFLQPFQPLIISWQGKSELMTLTLAESHGAPIFLQGKSLLSGFYLNELLSRLLPKQDAHPKLYTIYQHTLIELAQHGLQHKILRLFEKKLLEELGYGILKNNDVIAEKHYRFHPEKGFEPSELSDNAAVFSGKSLLAFAAEHLEEESVLRDAKRLMRIALASMLGSKPLESRKLFSEFVI